MRIAVGPVLFDWGKRAIEEYYRRLAFESEADILYLGEVVCSKRLGLGPEELGRLARELAGSGKEVVFSTLGLVMNDGELERVRRVVALAGELGLKVEANDMAAIGLGEGQPMVAGPHINTYNPETLAFLATVGVVRVVLPVELSARAIAGVIGKRGDLPMERELFAYGHMPLTFSARCYTARAFELPKSNCQYKCGEFPEGLPTMTQDGSDFLLMNGIQTMSARVCNLVAETEEIQGLGVDIVRLSPRKERFREVVGLWRQRLDGRLDAATAAAKLAELDPGTRFCNGYFHGRPGLEQVP
ncbi:MAG: U32 family peptidase [Magnetococcales bacterium]|nr:U32 family peptidase [Magnetococcales bacterium]